MNKQQTDLHDDIAHIANQHIEDLVEPILPLSPHQPNVDQLASSGLRGKMFTVERGDGI